MPCLPVENFAATASFSCAMQDQELKISIESFTLKQLSLLQRMTESVFVLNAYFIRNI